MAKGPRGERRPANPFEAAIMVGRIATGEIQDSALSKNAAAVELGRRGGQKGGKARAAKLNPVKRAQIARKAAKARWKHQ